MGRVWFICAGLAHGALACTPAQTVDLLELDQIAPSVIRQGNRVYVQGRGFPVGRTCVAYLEGVVGPRSVKASAACRALSSTQLEVHRAEHWLEQTGAGVFTGLVRVHFPTRDGASFVSGSLSGVKLTLADDGSLPASEQSPARTASGRRDAPDRSLLVVALLIAITTAIALRACRPSPETWPRSDRRDPSDSVSQLGDELVRLAVFALISVTALWLASRLSVAHVVLASLAAAAWDVAVRSRSARATGLAMGLVVSMAALSLVLTGTTLARGVVGRQGPWPWQWLALSNPAALLWLIAAWAALGRLARYRRSRSPSVVLLCLSATLVVGGWKISTDVDDVGGLAVAALCGKAWLIHHGAVRFPLTLRRRTILSLAFAAPALGLVWTLVDPPRTVVSAVETVTASLFSLMWIRLVLSRTSRSNEAMLSHAHPFL